jgi:alkaline phosphatase D
MHNHARRGVGVTALFLSLVSFSHAATITNAIVVGGVTHDAARLWIRLDDTSSVRCQLALSPTFTSVILTSQERATLEKNFAVIVRAEGLQPNTRYYYRALVNGVPHARVGSFSTFPTPGTSSTFTFAFGSCQQSGPFLPSPNPRGQVYREVIRANPRFFLQIGDWGYPDTTDRIPTDSNFFSHDYRKVQLSYLEKALLRYPMDTLLMNAPIDYVYDDHDFMNNNASATTASFSIPVRPSVYGTDFIAREIRALPQGRINSIRGYKENFPTYPLANESRGIYHKFTYGNVDVFMLDTRAQRSPNQNSLRRTAVRWEFSPPAGHSILGRENAPGTGQSQMQWFLTELQNSQATWKFVVSSVPFNNAQAAAILLGMILQDSLISLPGTTERVSPIFAAMELADKWCGFPDDVRAVLDHIRNNNIRNVIVLSGDQHTAAMDDGTNAGLPEIMAGGLDITNSRIVALFEAFGLRIWNRGGQGISTTEFNNAFGKVTVFGSDSVRLALVDEFGTQFASHTVLNRVTSVQHSTPPTQFILHQNYPNPFNPSTTIRFELPEESVVRLSFFDVLGRSVETIHETRTEGSHAIVWTPRESSSGVYHCVVEAMPLRGGATVRASRRMIFLK